MIFLQCDCLFVIIIIICFFVSSTLKGIIMNILWMGNNSLLSLAEVRNPSVLQSLLLS